MSQLTHHITHLLHQIQVGDTQAKEALFNTLYSELRRIAEAKLGPEPADCLLQPTMLVHEAYLKLFGPSGAVPAFDNRRHFFGTMSRAMQQVLVDYARQRLSKKRTPPSGGLVPQPAAIEARCEEILQVAAQLERLAAENPQAAELVRARFFGGYSMAEAAEMLDVSLRTAQRLWAVAQTRLRQWLKHPLAEQ